MGDAFKFLISFYVLMYIVLISLSNIVGTPFLATVLSYGGIHAFAFLGAWYLFGIMLGEFLNKRIPKPRNF